MPDLSFEIAAGLLDGAIICGVDEVGRGPLAGPVVAAAVIMPIQGLPPELADEINDSKKLSGAKRQALHDILIGLCPYAVAEASVAEIDQMNILWAAMLAMQRAVSALPVKPAMALIDGNRCPELACPAQAVVGGDGKSLSIAAASIIAKVRRDRMMAELAAQYPVYGWERNAGYGTPQHLAALASHGTSPWHRDSFAPVYQISRAKR
ncbi:MAG: ribonuclease HII [Alphaproteobacteria bacterium]